MSVEHSQLEHDVGQLVQHILEELDLSGAKLNLQQYSAVPLCIIDAVFSLGVRYTSVLNVIDNFCEHHKWEKRLTKTNVEHTTSELVSMLSRYRNRLEKVDVFHNKQRTSTRAGIRKAEAVCRFASVLQSYGIETLLDAKKNGKNPKLRSEIAKIPGQKSGLSLDYFLMLVGHTDIVKADRMVCRFVADAVGKPRVPQDYAKELVISACTALKQQFKQRFRTLSPAKLDNAIWKYQSGKRLRRLPRIRPCPTCED